MKGWQEATDFTAEEVIRSLEPYCSGFLCTYVDKEGMIAGHRSGLVPASARATKHELTAAGGITTSKKFANWKTRIHSALGMAIYTGRLNLQRTRQLIYA